jgi:hypothetical protein
MGTMGGAVTSAASQRLVRRLVLVVVCAVQLIRITHGVDFVDEMMSYGELSNLVDSNRLFSADLFMQQITYLPLYPVFKLLSLVLGTSFLLVSGRVVFALFVLWAFGRVRRSLEASGTPPAAASVAALVCTFAIPFGNIYALSYHTVGFGLLAVTFAGHSAWRANGRPIPIVFWSLVLLGFAFAHQPLAVGVAGVLLARLWLDRDFAAIRRLLLTGGALGAVAALLVIPFLDVSDLVTSIAFSRAISVGQIFQHAFPYLMALEAAAITLCLVTQREAPSVVTRFDNALVPLSVAATLGAGIAAANAARFGADYWFAAIACAFAGLAITAWPRASHVARRAWLTTLFVMASTIGAMVSSNGFRQIQGAGILAAAFYFALALTPPENEPRRSWRLWSGWTLGASMLVAVSVFLLWSPMGETLPTHETVTVGEVPAFRGLRVSPTQAGAIRAIRAMLPEAVPRSRVLVLGPHPWIYFALDAWPDTDMLFMHRLGKPAAYEILADRLLKRRPELIVAAGGVPDEITRAFEELVRTGPYVCDQRTITAPLLNAGVRLGTYWDLSPAITVCRYAPSAAR